jgi:ribonuclease HI
MHIDIFTDGSSRGNPGPGGWAYLLRVTDKDCKEIPGDGGEAYTTNNRMELMAVIEGLAFARANFPEAKEIRIVSDSSWVINTMTKNWKRKKNLDLWAMLTPLLKDLKIDWKWVKGHAGHRENEDCDSRATRQADRQARLPQKSQKTALKEPVKFLKQSLF